MKLPQFETLADDEPALGFSPLVRAVSNILEYSRRHGDIGLTKSGRFRRSFVEWSVHAFDWPGYRSVDLAAVCKVLNEADFDPLFEVHHLMIQLKLGRHAKGSFGLTNAGRELSGRQSQLFELVAPFYLYRFDRLSHARRTTSPFHVDWDVYLNVLNLEADHGARCADLADSLLGMGKAASGSDELLHEFHEQVLRPLAWLGLIAVIEDHRSIRDRYYAKTPLWRVALKLDTDSFVDRPLPH